MVPRFHPKVRLLFATGVMAVAFGAHRLSVLLILSALLAVVSWWCRCGTDFWLALLKRLRWLLLATLLLHLFFFPGHTIGSLTWLSLDGFERGLVLCWRMLLAFGASGLLAKTTSGEDQAGSLVHLMAPVGRVFPATKTFLRLVPTAVCLLPEVRRQTAATWKEQQETRCRLTQGSLIERASAASDLVEQLVLSLADLGESKAQAMVVERRGVLPGTDPLTDHDRRALAVGLLLLIFWLVT